MRYKDNATTSIQYLDVEQGLGYSYVTAICKDKRGLLWFGIDGMGLSKYDGINITTYSVKEGLTNNIVNSIIEDRNNNLWMGTNGGVTCFDGKNFIQFTEKDGLPSNQVQSILEDKKGDLWFCTVAGLTKYDGNYFTNYSRKEGLPVDSLYNNVYKCIEDRHGNLWIGTHNGVAEFDGKIFTHYTSKDGLAGNLVSEIMEDSGGNIWFGSFNEGLARFDGNKFTRFTKKEGLADNVIWSILEDDSHNIWISTSNGGLNKYDGKNFIRYSIEQGLSNVKVRRMAKDGSGNLWLATEGGGVNKLNTTNFNYLVPEAFVENNRIRPILKDKNGNLWFGTEDANVGTLNMGDAGGKGKEFTYFKVQEKLSWKGQRSLLQDKNGNIWIGTTGSGLIKYDGKNFINYSTGNGPPRQAVFDILEDKKGMIWFGQNDGKVSTYDAENFSSFSSKEGWLGSAIYAMLQDRKENIWFCTEGAGVIKYDGTNLINYTEKEGLFTKSVTSVAEDDKGNIWLGTLGAGVCKFNGVNFTYYTVQQGMPDNNVWSVFCDPSGQLWFGTDKGLALFILKTDSLQDAGTGYNIYNFGSQDGLKAIDFNLHSVCVDDNNHIWWGTGKSAPSFDLDKKFNPGSLGSPGLNFIEINDKVYDFRNLHGSEAKNIKCSDVIPFTNCPVNLSVSSDLNHISFHFSAIDWSAPHKIKYSYRMVGLDVKWSRPSREPVADYRNLSHGDYLFQVRAIGQSNAWTEPFSYNFTIRPAWWQTWWFKILMIATGLALIFFSARFIYYYQLRKQRIVLEKQLAVQYERQRISSEMHDDIGAGLSGVRLLTEITKNKLKNTDATGDIDKIYQSVDDISAKMKEVIWSLNTENDDISSMISYIVQQVRIMVEHYSCELSIDLPDKFPDIEISGEARRNIYLAVKESVHNIIKHSGASMISLSVSCNTNLLISIRDNGKGFNNSDEAKGGNGLRNMRQRMKNIGGNLILQSHDGTSVLFEIPLNQSK
jgi:ligand-binding sensor domain-containing protein/signal transduction histidine kinase